MGGICEVTLYANILLSNILYHSVGLLFGLCKGRPTFVESKEIAVELRNLSTLSILRYMPSVELVSSFVVHWRETLAKIIATLIQKCKFGGFSVASSVRRNYCDLVFS